jgi:hypothetical protein
MASFIGFSKPSPDQYSNKDKNLMAAVFISSTLKAEWNKDFNLKFCIALEEKGIQCYLPQRDTKQDGTEFDKFHENMEAIRSSSVIISIGVNESVNWGLENGYAYGIDKPIILLTDKPDEIHTMALGIYSNIFKINIPFSVNSLADQVITHIQSL